MSDKLKNKTIVVTGANGIIGYEVCRLAMEEGANVAALDLNDDKLKQLKKFGGERLLFIKCDVRKMDSIVVAYAKIVDTWGKIHCLHNNAAWKTNDLQEFFKSFEEYSLKTWHEVLSVNLDGMMLVDQVIGSNMAKQNDGSIVHTASIYGIVGPDQRIYEGSSYMGSKINTPAVYSVSKGAVISLTNYLATYWGVHGVRVNSITPGGVESGQNSTFVSNYRDKVPLGRMANAKEVASAVIFLLSDDSSYVNGHNLIVDGGFTVW